MSVQTAPFGRVRDKVAIVTSAASGIGLATLRSEERRVGKEC